MLKNCISIKNKFIQRYFSKIFLFSGIPYNFLEIEGTPIWRNTSWSQHLHAVGLNAALFWNEKKHSLTVIKDMQMFYPHLRDRNQLLEKYKIKKSIRGVKVKNGNGPVKVFIYYCSTPRSVCIVRHSIQYENRANLFWF